MNACSHECFSKIQSWDSAPIWLRHSYSWGELLAPLDSGDVTDRRLMLVHAHPDDESSQSSATMARYAADEAQVTLVTCTLGERGEILVPEWEHFTPAELGEHRAGEIADALSCLGVTDHVWLGGRGTYHDTGMTTDDEGRVTAPDDVPANAFWTADLLEASLSLVELIRDRRPQVLTSYDPFGGYGHPDHVQAHRVTMYAAHLAGANYRLDLGQPWAVQRILWSTNNTDNWIKAAQVAREMGLERFQDWDEEQLRSSSAVIDAIVGYEGWLEQCTMALSAHRSQVRLDDDFWRFFQIMREQEGGGEAYQLAAGVPFPQGVVATDLFQGLDV